MWDSRTANELVKEGMASKDELTNRIAKYLDYALSTVEYYQNLYMIERDKNNGPKTSRAGNLKNERADEAV